MRSKIRAASGLCRSVAPGHAALLLGCGLCRAKRGAARTVGSRVRRVRREGVPLPGSGQWGGACRRGERVLPGTCLIGCAQIPDADADWLTSCGCRVGTLARASRTEPLCEDVEMQLVITVGMPVLAHRTRPGHDLRSACSIHGMSYNRPGRKCCWPLTFARAQPISLPIPRWPNQGYTSK